MKAATTIFVLSASMATLSASFGNARAQTVGTPYTGSAAACTAGKVGVFACSNVDLLSYLPASSFGDANDNLGPAITNDNWGWTDPTTGKEYALVGRRDLVAFIDISDPVNPVYLGALPTQTSTNASQADVKTYGNYALVVREASSHGMQIFDLTKLRGVTNPPIVFSKDAHYTDIGSAHNVVVNETSGYAYVVGARGANGEGAGCALGLHIVDVSDPLNPAFAGCFNTSLSRGYTHDAQCVMYNGPDLDYPGREICFSFDEQGITISDVTDKSAIVEISATSYPNVQYTHQGWLTEDHTFLYVDDELDEPRLELTATRTLIWDVSDLDDPILAKEHLGTTPSIDHNQYVRENYLFQSNYKAGLRILDITDRVNPVEVAYFDTYPPNDSSGFSGSWSNYPFFDSGVVIATSIGEGLFVLQPDPNVVSVDTVEPPPDLASTRIEVFPNPMASSATIRADMAANDRVDIIVYDLLGREVKRIFSGPLPQGSSDFVFHTDGLPTGPYLVVLSAAKYRISRFVTSVR